MTLPDITIAKKTLVSLLDASGGTISGEELVNRLIERNREVILAADGNAASAKVDAQQGGVTFEGKFKSNGGYSRPV